MIYLWFFSWLVSHASTVSVLSDVVTAVLIFATAIIAWLALRETQKQTKIDRDAERPYMSVHWVSDPEVGSRVEQGVRSTCLKLRNVGRSIMREVRYQVSLNGNKIPVKNHAIISEGSATWIVYGNTDSNELGAGNIGLHLNPELNARRILGTTSRNDRLIGQLKKDSLKVSGYYRDIAGICYPFTFSFDPDQQSWFNEIGNQVPVDCNECRNKV